MSKSNVIVTAAALLAICATGDIASAESASVRTSAAAYSAPALYDAGNHAARAGNPALAVLNYERALVLAPADADTRANLQATRDSLGLAAQPGNWLTRHSRLAAPNTMYWIGLLGIVLAGASFLAWRSRGSKGLPLAAAIFVGTAMTGASIGNAVATLPILSEAVVMQATPASAAPILGTEPQFTVPAAAVVHICDEHGAFVLIRDSQNREGWVARANLTPVIPERAPGGR